MKKAGIINKDISEVIAGMGHKDMLVVCDAGLPIPPSVRRIDLALKQGCPGFIETVAVIAEELQVESFIIADETENDSNRIKENLQSLFPGAQAELRPHDQIKQLSASAVAIVRTGEFTPYANVILVSGVVF